MFGFRSLPRPRKLPRFHPRPRPELEGGPLKFDRPVSILLDCDPHNFTTIQPFTHATRPIDTFSFNQGNGSIVFNGKMKVDILADREIITGT